MKCEQLALRVLSTVAILSIVSSIAAPVFAETYFIGNGHDLTIETTDDGEVYVNGHKDADGNIVINGGSGSDSLSKQEPTPETEENTEEERPVTEDAPEEDAPAEAEENAEEDADAEEPEEPSDEETEADPAEEEEADPAAEADAEPEAEGEEETPAEEAETSESAENIENAETAPEAPATQEAAEENTPVEQEEKESRTTTSVSNVIKVVNKWKDKILKITLDNVNIKTASGSTEAAMSVAGSGDTEVDLVGNNVLDSSLSNAHAGLEKACTVDIGGNKTNDGGKLIITASDTTQSLTALGADYAAGIGGRSYGVWESKASITGIEINGGKIYAESKLRGAGIGGGSLTSGEVTINGGDVTAIGGTDEGCGIGSGKWAKNSEVTINGGNVIAKSTQGGAGIGGTYSKVTITSGTVHATGGASGTNASGTIGGGAGIGGYGADITITGGNVTATGTDGGAGVGNPGGKADSNIAPGKIEISGTAQVTATGGNAVNGSGYSYSVGAAIGNGSALNGDVKGEEVEIITGDTTTATIIRNSADVPANHQHNWTVTDHEDATTEHGGKTEYTCTGENGCGATRTDYFTALHAPDEETNSDAEYEPLTVLGADSFEQTVEDGRLLIAVPEESASLTGSLAALRELEAGGIDTLAFRTEDRESVLNLADLTALGSDDTVFVLSHNGENAALTVSGRDCTALLAR